MIIFHLNLKDINKYKLYRIWKVKLFNESGKREGVLWPYILIL
jgi:hypothetical protein